jgi:hypothetical protein
MKSPKGWFDSNSDHQAFAQVAQLISGRDSSRQNGDCRERGVRRGATASRPDHTWRCSSNWIERLFRKQQVVSSNLTITSISGPRTRHRSSKPNLRELGGQARGSTPPRASKRSQWLCSSNGESKRLISARLVVQLHPQPPNFLVA